MVTTAAVALSLAACGSRRPQRSPTGYPAAYPTTIRDADREGRLVIWSALERNRAEGLLAAFRRRYPGIAVGYRELPGADLDAAFRAAARAGGPLPDLVWSSAMDLQIKLANDGYAQAYRSPEAPHLPSWANWKDQAWGTTAEPIVFIYNRRLIEDAAMPRDHRALARFLQTQPPARREKVATYDLPVSAVGYLYFAQDQQATHAFWPLVQAMSGTGLRTFRSAEEVVGDVSAGRSAIGYDIIGSFAVKTVARDPRVGLVLPSDYALVVSRIAIIPAAAPHPAAARLFLDHLLSRAGQAQLVAQRMRSVRSDLPEPTGLVTARTPLRAIRVGPGLLVDSDRLTRAHVLRRWRATLTGQAPRPWSIGPVLSGGGRL